MTYFKKLQNLHHFNYPPGTVDPVVAMFVVAGNSGQPVVGHFRLFEKSYRHYRCWDPVLIEQLD